MKLGSECSASPTPVSAGNSNARSTPAARSPSTSSVSFDWSWANAYERAGLNYYPKLVSAAPFTPAPSRRLLADNPDHGARLIEALDKMQLVGSSPVERLGSLFDQLAPLDLVPARAIAEMQENGAGFAGFATWLMSVSAQGATP